MIGEVAVLIGVAVVEIVDALDAVALGVFLLLGGGR